MSLTQILKWVLQLACAAGLSLGVSLLIGPAYVVVVFIVMLTAWILMLKRSWPGAWVDRILIIGLGVVLGIFWPILPIIAAVDGEKTGARSGCDGRACQQTPCVCDRKGERA